MKKKLFLLLALIVFIAALLPAKANSGAALEYCAQPDITSAMLQLYSEYPEGMTWTNKSPASAYVWKFPGSIVTMSGCAAFSAILQDRVFGPATSETLTWQKVNGVCHTAGISQNPVSYAWKNLWPGDIIQFNGHTVIVLRKYADKISIAEGNYCGTIHWGRELTKDMLEESALYVLTRYGKNEPLMPYIDFPEKLHWSRDPMAWAFCRKVARPTTELTVSPCDACSRADLVTFLWAASGSPIVERDNPFTDVSEADPYYKAVMWALDNGIAAGTSSTTFTPSSLCTRAEAITFLWRAAGSPMPDTENQPFSDVRQGDFWLMPVAWAVRHGITSGTTPTTFSPNWIVLRTDALTFIYHLFGN